MKTKDIEYFTSLCVKLDNYDYELSCMKEPDYTMNIISTYGGLTVNNGQKYMKKQYKYNNLSMKTTTFNYAKPFCNQFIYCHAIDDHNTL